MTAARIVNCNPERETDERTRANLRAIADHLAFDHYVVSVDPGSMVLGTSATHAVVGTRWGVVVLPDAASSGAFYTFERPSQWVSGKIKVTIHYSSPTGSTNDFLIAIQVSQAKDGSVMTGTTLILSDFVLLAGPAVANTRVSYSVYSTANVTQEFDLIQIRVGRVGADATDTNANGFHLYNARVEFIPAMLEVDVQ